jgi:hypothetical protein
MMFVLVMEISTNNTTAAVRENPVLLMAVKELVAILLSQLVYGMWLETRDMNCRRGNSGRKCTNYAKFQ